MLVLAIAVCIFIPLNIGSLPDRIISGTGPGGLRYAPKEILWLYPSLIILFMLLGLFTNYLSRVAPDIVNLRGVTKPGLKKQRTELQGAMIAICLLVGALNIGFGPYRLWIINTAQATAQSVFGWPTFVGLAVPISIVFIGYLQIDRRYRE